VWICWAQSRLATDMFLCCIHLITSVCSDKLGSCYIYSGSFSCVVTSLIYIQLTHYTKKKLFYIQMHFTWLQSPGTGCCLIDSRPHTQCGLSAILRTNWAQAVHYANSQCCPEAGVTIKRRIALIRLLELVCVLCSQHINWTHKMKVISLSGCFVSQTINRFQQNLLLGSKLNTVPISFRSVSACSMS
jgi:hypothetical protein